MADLIHKEKKQAMVEQQSLKIQQFVDCDEMSGREAFAKGNHLFSSNSVFSPSDGNI